MNTKIFALRGVRKSSYLASKSLHKVLSITTRVEDKTTRILTGVDFSVSAFKEIPFEKAFFNGVSHNIAPLNPALPAVGRKGKVTLLIPSLRKQSFYGGTATALIVAAKLAVKSNKQLRIIETLQPGGKEGLGDFLNKYGLGIEEESVELIDVSSRSYNIYGYIDLHPDDVFLASAWWDAYVLDQLPLNKKYLYLIQDFEPIFYSNSDEYVLAENTYHSDRFIPICNTKLMYDYMATTYPYIKDNGLFFEPAMSQTTAGLVVKKTSGEKKRIFLYGRPDVKRNLFYCGLDALNRAFTSGELNPNEWEVSMAGQDKIPNIILSSGIIVQNLGKLSLEDYYAFVRSVDLTISLMMAPHPNYPTLELSSVGSMVVTTKYHQKTDLSMYSDNIMLADLTVKSIADTIIAASNVSYEQRIKNAKATQTPVDWNVALDPIVESALSSLSK